MQEDPSDGHCGSLGPGDTASYGAQCRPMNPGVSNSKIGGNCQWSPLIIRQKLCVDQAAEIEIAGVNSRRKPQRRQIQPTGRPGQ